MLLWRKHLYEMLNGQDVFTLKFNVKFFIYFLGGGWCNNVTTCLSRKNTHLGSSKQMVENLAFSGILSNRPQFNPDLYNWNRVKVGYCDGSFFTGDVQSGKIFLVRLILKNTSEMLSAYMVLPRICRQCVCTSRLKPDLCFFPQNVAQHVQTHTTFPSYDSWQNIVVSESIKCARPFLSTPAMHTVKLKFKKHDHSCRTTDSAIKMCLLQTIAKALGDWFYDKNPFQKIDCPYPCDNRVFYPNAHTFDIDRSCSLRSLIWKSETPKGKEACIDLFVKYFTIREKLSWHEIEGVAIEIAKAVVECSKWKLSATALENAPMVPPEKVDPLGSSSSRQKYCENEQLPSITNMATIDGFLDIKAEAMQKGKRAFFIDGPGGTGKSFLYHALIATVRYRGFIALATASSGVAASLLPGGRTAHPFSIADNVVVLELAPMEALFSMAEFARLPAE
ncbi:hypothetical protein MTR67_023867 [Solanum verrucosum]|uniref:Multifunctional fusion protein n=1 Tax=Solanum verrucosum TaxID=315347 RepID=A0AAF0QXQ8_SOLVR|nr:hypothetical protein MTR67_023867 [Solanum verrucosum]